MHVHRGRIVTSDAVITDGVVATKHGLITYVGPFEQAPEPIRKAAPNPSDGYVLPGLVDVHNHGGGGVSFPDATTVEQIAHGVSVHSGSGTTKVNASLVTAEPDRLRRQVRLLRCAAQQGVIAGIHLEGPFISAKRCGAQNPNHIIDGDPDLVAELLQIGQGWVKTVTLAPETPHFASVVDAIVHGGAVPSYGHTDANNHTMARAIQTGVEVLTDTGKRATITHLFNGMRPFHHRDPGPVPAVLAAAQKGQVVIELIGDGIHVDLDLIGYLFDLVGADNIVLVTDAMAAAGMDDGAYRLGGLDVKVDQGVARLVRGGAIAGGTARLVDVVRAVVGAGVSVVDAVKSAATVPARVLDPHARYGELKVGYEAHVVCVDEEFNRG